MKYELAYWFEHGGNCLWGRNEAALKAYGCCIKNEALPLSKNVIAQLYALEYEFRTYLDWDCPQNPSPWSREQKQIFLNKAREVYGLLVSELGEDYTIHNELNSCIF